MTHIPSPETIIHLLHRMDEAPADHLESEILDFKRWRGVKNSLTEAVQMAVCFANAEGGLVVFGVRDNVKGRTKAITGCERYDLDVWRRGIYESTRPHLTVEISELEVPEGNLILVRVPKGPAPPYGTAAGLYQIRVGKNCMPWINFAYIPIPGWRNGARKKESPIISPVLQQLNLLEKECTARPVPSIGFAGQLWFVNT